MSIRIRQSIRLMLVILLPVIFPGYLFAADETDGRSVGDSVRGDYQEFYSRDRLLRLGIAFGVGGVMANTSVDQNIQDWYQDDVRSFTTDDIAEIAKIFGEGKYLIPLSLLSAAVGSSSNSEEETSAVGKWGRCTARAYLVGGPAMLIMQQVTGGSRPGESEEGSSWDPFNDSNGVSGHAFIGAVPFLTIAHMNEENRAVRYLLYAASVLTALSRINDNDHFASQAALGWYMAWEAADAVCERDKEESTLVVRPMFTDDSYGVCVSLKW